MRLALLAIVAPTLLIATAAADTIVLKGGKKIAGVVVSREDDEQVVINPWNSRHPAMVWEIPDKNRIPREKVEQVLREDDPTIEYRRRASRPALSADERVELARFADANKMKDEREQQLTLALRADPTHAAALEEYGATKWESLLRRDPSLSTQVAELERQYVSIRDAAEVAAAYDRLKQAGGDRSITYMERARRSAAIPTGRRDKVPLTIGSQKAPGATYAAYVSRKVDPLQPTALVIGLHGGGDGGKDDTLVTGSGEAALPFYTSEAEEWGWIVICPSALKAPWSNPANEPVLDSVIEEAFDLFNIDPHRVYLTGHSMGGFGTWYWAPQRADLFAACSPCAGGGGTRNAGVFQSGEMPVYIFHGSDDNIVQPGNDRDMARLLLGGKRKTKADAVYTELDGVGHGFPGQVRRDIFEWFAGRWKDNRRLKDSTFDDKVSREEIAAFGDPSELPRGGEEDASSPKALIARLKLGGGAAAEAADALAQHKDDATVDLIGDVLRSRKTTPDVRAAAVKALGAIALPSGLDHLERVADDEDYRVVDAVVAALAAIGSAEARPALAKATANLSDRFRESFSGDAVTHTEYDVRLTSLTHAAEAIAKFGDAGGFYDLVAQRIVEPVFLPKAMYRVYGDDDPRFQNVSKDARRRLARAVVDCCIALGDAQALAVCRRAQETWRDESRTADEFSRAVDFFD